MENSVDEEGKAMQRGDHKRAEEIRRGREDAVPAAWHLLRPESTDDIIIGIAMLWVARAAAPAGWVFKKLASAGNKPGAACRSGTVACNVADKVAVKIAGIEWRVFRVGEKACQKGCEDAAEAIHQAIGGEIHMIKPMGPNADRKVLGGVTEIDGTVYKNPAGDGAKGWYNHSVVIKDGRVFDALTGPDGQTIADYKARWEYFDAIEWGF